MIEEIRNIGIFAHVDAGKTTVSEHFLFLSGKIKKLGSVDAGTAQSDFTEVEKSGGISVRSSYLNFEWKNVKINLIDTPGHIDFSADVERSIRVTDAAILIISAVEGVQAYTETIWRALKKRNIPILFFINKIDRSGADTQRIIEEIEEVLTMSVAVLHKTEDEGTDGVKIKSVWNNKNLYEKTIENLAECSEEILNLYIDEKEISFKKANSVLKQAVRDVQIFPVLFGSAKKSLGIGELLDAIVDYFPPPVQIPTKEFSAFVFAVTYDKDAGKIAHVKVLSGSVKIRDSVINQSRKTEEKVTRIKKIFAGFNKDVEKVVSGDIAGLCGLKQAQTGDVLGVPANCIPEKISVKTSLFTVRIIPEQDKDFSNLAYALQELTSEDPSLGFKWLKEEQELHINIMGNIQMRVLESILNDRFSIKAKFENPTVIYKETPSKSGEGFVRYWMPKPCWAILKFKIEPGERGSGVVYQSEVSVDDIRQKYQNEIEKTISEALKQGIKGWEVTDIKITLIEGEDHPIHSHPGDFVVATPMGIMNGLKNTGTTLLEPVVSFKISASEELLGKIVGDITQMRGSFESPVIKNGNFILTGLLPLATSADYSIKLNSRSGGKAKFSTEFHSYKACTDDEGQIREYKGISPLDTAKYILKARKALQ